MSNIETFSINNPAKARLEESIEAAEVYVDEIKSQTQWVDQMNSLSRLKAVYEETPDSMYEELLAHNNDILLKLESIDARLASLDDDFKAEIKKLYENANRQAEEHPEQTAAIYKNAEQLELEIVIKYVQLAEQLPVEKRLAEEAREEIEHVYEWAGASPLPVGYFDEGQQPNTEPDERNDPEWRRADLIFDAVADNAPYGWTVAEEDKGWTSRLQKQKPEDDLPVGMRKAVNHQLRREG